MGRAAKLKPPTAKELESKPWLAGYPRLIFVSDMGDALSKGISFEYLRQEIFETALSEAGRRHIWLWLSKRPARMAKFGQWLLRQGGRWPDNLMAMTTVTSQSKASRVDELQRRRAVGRAFRSSPYSNPSTWT
jgi:protein gp37